MHFSPTWYACTEAPLPAYIKKSTISVLTPCRQKPQSVELSSRTSDTEVLLCELHLPLVSCLLPQQLQHALSGDCHVRVEERKTPLLSRLSIHVYIFPFLVCLRPWETFTQNILEWHSKSALELSQVYKLCSLHTGHIRGASDINSVVYWSLCQNKVDKLLLINTQEAQAVVSPWNTITWQVFLWRSRGLQPVSHPRSLPRPPSPFIFIVFFFPFTFFELL